MPWTNEETNSLLSLITGMESQYYTYFIWIPH